MNGPKTATANWKTQYYLTVSSAHDSPTPASGWYDSGTSITASVTSPSAGPVGTQYVCTGWTGTGSTPASGSFSLVIFTINTPSTITWNWKTQYQVVFDQSGVGSDFTSTVVMIDGVGYGRSGLPTAPQFWWDQGSSHNFSYASPLPVNGGKNYVWASTSGLSNLQNGTFTITSSGNIVGNYIEQNRITFAQTGVGSDFTGTVIIIDGVNYDWSQLPVSFPWVLNTDHSFAFQSPLVPGANTKYVWNSTTGLSSLQSGSITVTTYGSIVGNYKTQYYLTVSSAYGVTDGQGWYDSGSPAYATVTPLTVAGPSGTQYVFTNWSGDASGTTSPSNAIAMNGPKTATANWKTQYYLAVSSLYGTAGGQGWYDSGVTAYATVTPLTVAGPSGTQYVFTNWSGDASGSTSPSNPIVMSAPKTATANWKTQYYLTVATNPLGVNSPTGSGWYDAGTNATISADAFVSIDSGSRYRFDGWTTANMAEIADPSRSPTQVTMDEGKTVTANYFVQYKLTFNQTGVSNDFGGAIVTVDGTNFTYGLLPHDFWWDNDSQHSFTFQSPLVVATNNKQYVWVNTTGLSTVRSGILTVSTSGSVTGNYKTQYWLTVSSDHDTPTPASGWYDAGTSISASVTTPWAGSTGSRFVCTGWTGTGSVPPSGTSSSTTFTINQVSSLTWNWKTRYLLTVLTSPTGFTPQPVRNPLGETGPANGWWYDASTSVTLTAQSVTGYNFKNWVVDGVSQGNGVNPITVTMNAPRTSTATYEQTPQLSVDINPHSDTIYLGQSVHFTSTVSGGVEPYSYQWYVNSLAITGANSPTWTFTPNGTGVYYVYVQVSDSLGSTAQSPIARITVITVPVGGFSVSVATQYPTLQIAVYAMLLTLFGAVLSLRKRKRK
jgi:hypothetical protein